MTELRFEGVTQSVEEWAADYGIPCKLIHSRLKRGWSVERAITEPMQVRRGDKLKAADLQDVQPTPAPASSVTTKTALTSPRLRPRERLMRPAPRYAERPITLDNFATPAKPRPHCLRGERFTHNGETLTLREWAERLGARKNTLEVRLHTHGWTVERTLTTPIGSRSRRPKSVSADSPGAGVGRA